MIQKPLTLQMIIYIFQLSSIMSEDQPSQPPKKRKCDKCNRKINTGRFEIHYAKCDPQKKKGKASKEYSEPILKQQPGAKIEVKKHQDGMSDTFPCYLCGFEMKITELDSHPLRCSNREISCWFCYVKFPVSIMANHEEVCPRRLRMEAQNREVAPASVPPKPPVVQEAPIVPLKPAEIVSIPPKHIQSLSIPPKPAQNAQIPPKQPEFKPVPIKPIENSSVPPKPASIPSKPAPSSHHSLPKHNVPQKPIPRPPASTSIARNPDSKSNIPHNKSVPRPQSRSIDEHRKKIAANIKEKEKTPQTKVEKEVKSQISQKENIVRVVEVKVNPEKANSSQPAAVITNTNTNASTNSATDIALELPRRFGEQYQRRQEQALTRQIDRIQARVNRLIQENANRRKTSKQAGLLPSLIQMIPEKRYVFNFDDLECPICCIEFQTSDQLKDLRCRHNYHSKCISEWLKINRSCPLCKTDLSINIPNLVEEKPIPPSKENFASFINA